MFNHPFGFNAGPPRWEPPLEGSTIREAVHSLLATTAGVVAMAGDRVYFGDPPQDHPRPFVSFVLIGSDARLSLRGSSRGRRARVAISCVADMESDAAAMAAAIHDRLASFRGYVGSVYIFACVPADEADIPARLGAGTDESRYQVSLDFTVGHLAD